jgi:phage shock protein PspC (stress-responsive transcriptional regulator)
MIAGVSGGLAEYFDIDVTLVRLGWVVLCFVTFGMALLGYIVLAILMPKDGASDVEAGYTSADETDPPSEQTSPRRPIAPSRRRRGDVLAMILIGIGAVVLVTSQGWVPLNWGVIWPLVFIGIGVTVMLRRPRSR